MTVLLTETTNTLRTSHVSRRQSRAVSLHAATACLAALICVFALAAPPQPTAAQSKTAAAQSKTAAAQSKTDSSPPASSSASTPPASSAPALLTRTTTRREVRRFGYGGTVTIYGAPEGSITIKGWSRSEVEVVADIEVRAATEDEMSRLAAVNNFVLDDDQNHLTLVTTGTHDRKFMKNVGRDFPKKLLSMPWKIDYRIRVPAMTDLEVYAGRGPLSLAGVEGAIRMSAGESDATLLLTGGSFDATLQSGTVNLRVGGRSWRGRGANVRLASGRINLELPANLSADLDAALLRSGSIENTYNGLAPRERTPQSETVKHLRAGAGGPLLSFTLGDGTLRITQAKEDGKP